MGLVNFIVDMSQSEHLSQHDEEIEKLKKDLETARAWIEYLQKEVEEIKNAKPSTEYD